MGVSAWQGGHQLAQKLIHTARPRRSARRTGAPLTSVSAQVDPSGLVPASSGAMLPGCGPTLGGPSRYAVGRGSAGERPPAVPRGTLAATSTTATMTTTPNTAAS